jgi:nucleoside-diphosphate-sugar epimerase
VKEQDPASTPPGLCLITGATGFIGGHLARRLAAEGVPVRCLARPGSDTSQLEQLGVSIARGDLTDPSSLAAAVEGASHVFHCGALVTDWATTKEIAAVNVAGTRNLLEASANAGVARFIHLSTTDVYGYPDRPGVDETYNGSRFRNWYAQSKLEAEAQVRRAEARGGLATVILRPATVYGPGSKEVVGEIAKAIRGRHMLLIDGGRPVAGLCFVENLIDAALLARRHKAAPGNAFNVTDGLPITWRQFTDDLAAGLGAPRVRLSLPYRSAYLVGLALEEGYRLLRGATGLTLPALLSRQAVQVLGKSQDFSNHKARELLGWSPRVSYAEGLQATITWLHDDHLR